MTEPGRREFCMAVRCEELADTDLIGLGRGCRKCERDLAQAKIEQPVAAPRLAIIIALGRCPAQYFDLAIVEAEPLIDPRDLRLGGAFVGQEDACRAAFDDRRRDA